MSEEKPEGCVCGGRHVVGRYCTSGKKRYLIESLLEEWEKKPTERLGQFLVNALWQYSGRLDDVLFQMEDDKVLTLILKRTKKEEPDGSADPTG